MNEHARTLDMHANLAFDSTDSFGRMTEKEKIGDDRTGM